MALTSSVVLLEKYQKIAPGIYKYPELDIKVTDDSEEVSEKEQPEQDDVENTKRTNCDRD